MRASFEPQLLSLRLQRSVQQGPQPSQPHSPSSPPHFPPCLPQTCSPPFPRLTPWLLPVVPAVPRLATGLPSCCGVKCGRGLRPRRRCPQVGEEGRACVPAFCRGPPLHSSHQAVPCHLGHGLTWPPPNFLPWAVPQRTSPTGPKNMQTSGRLSNVAPPCILRKNPPSARNGGHETDAQILELNQQVSGLGPGS